MDLKPYISIDLETTGLDRNRSEILEIGAVFEDGVSPLSELKTFHFLIKKPHYNYVEPYAAQMNQAIFVELGKSGVEPSFALYRLVSFFKEALVGVQSWHMKNNVKVSSRGPRVTIGGKNPAGFDIPILRNEMDRCNHELLRSFDELIDYQVIDPGPMYLKDFGRIAHLYEIKKHIGLGDNVSHRGKDDAFDVIKVIRHKLGIPF